ncbi:MAG: sugar ABC transporter permease [Caldilineaceae bacterium SB0662_bin_9]|uniref:Sugar ABC transporter permease n=1 Tax=Caldilineaceae bacterium SB0662_bin_9 TaxID=2605258 RepID=A0A6B1DYS6_9CHLR|nr:sugar ABC transporter permease [Caldilineaceae bacterium SB0666_bin_21]MYD91802.1 sugar ABC transporter permease [Caldilineaceae bacterium SB0662_bin_9]
MLVSLYFSFTEYAFPLKPAWIGLANYVRAFARDELFGMSLWNTLYYVGLAVPLGVCLSLMLALLLDRRISGRAIWRTIYYLPSIVPVVSATFLFLYIFQPDYGLINGWLWKLFEVEGPGWFNSRVWVKPTFILLALWSAGGPTMIILLAGLQNVPGEMYDAAKVDGAGRGRRFRHITLPLLSPTLFFVLITGLIAAFKIFGAVYVSTQGGPFYGSYFYVLHLFTQAFSHWQLGYASALAWILFVIVLVFTLIQFRFSGGWVHYEGETDNRAS